jgi:hypothetical protein
MPHSINGLLRPGQGDVLLYDPTVHLRGPATVHATWQAENDDLLLRIDPLRFERAHFEGCGTWLGNPGLPHFYGSGTGSVSYRLRAPRGGAPSALVIRMRASSELPGLGIGATDADTSTLLVFLDDIELGTLTAPPDDGNGGWIELTVTDPEILRMLARRTIHRLEVRTNGDAAGGVCLYEETDAGEPAGIELRWQRTITNR